MIIVSLMMVTPAAMIMTPVPLAVIGAVTVTVTVTVLGPTGPVALAAAAASIVAVTVACVLAGGSQPVHWPLQPVYGAVSDRLTVSGNAKQSQRRLDSNSCYRRPLHDAFKRG